MNKEIVIASSNAGKIREYREILAPLGYVVYSSKNLNISVDPEETGKTYRENALIKAKAMRSLVKWPVIADDSGIEIESLDHFPGIYTARYASSCGGYPETFVDINKKLEGKENRNAAYHCCICLLEHPDSKPLFFEGICEGYLLKKPVGTGGFGYDPMFHSYEADVDFGTCSEETKNKFSHRYKALIKLATYLSI